MSALSQYETLILAIGVGISLVTGIYSIFISRRAIVIAESALQNEKAVHSSRLIEKLASEISEYIESIDPSMKVIRSQAEAKFSNFGEGHDHDAYVKAISFVTDESHRMLMVIKDHEHLIGKDLQVRLGAILSRTDEMFRHNNADDFWPIFGERGDFIVDCLKKLKKKNQSIQEKILNV